MPTGVGARLVAVVFAISVVPGWLVTRLWYLHAGLPPTPSWIAAALVLLVAVALVVAVGPARRAWLVRSRQAVGHTAVRVLACAQAAAVTGALLSGWNVGYLITLAADLDAGSVRAAAGSAVALVVAGAVLLAAGLWGQRACRVPGEPFSG